MRLWTVSSLCCSPTEKIYLVVPALDGRSIQWTVAICHSRLVLVQRDHIPDVFFQSELHRFMSVLKPVCL